MARQASTPRTALVACALLLMAQGPLGAAADRALQQAPSAEELQRGAPEPLDASAGGLAPAPSPAISIESGALLLMDAGWTIDNTNGLAAQYGGAGMALSGTHRYGASFSPTAIRSPGVMAIPYVDSVELCLQAPDALFNSPRPTLPTLTIELYELAYASTADTAYIPSQYNATRVTRTVTLDKTSFSLIQLNAGWVTVTGLNASLRDFRPHVLTLRATGGLSWCTAAVPSGGQLTPSVPTATGNVQWMGYLSEPVFAADGSGSSYWAAVGQQLGMRLRGHQANIAIN